VADAVAPQEPPQPPKPLDSDGEPYQVSTLVFEYAQPADSISPHYRSVIGSLAGLQVMLLETEDGYVRCRPDLEAPAGSGVPVTTFTLASGPVAEGGAVAAGGGVYRVEREGEPADKPFIMYGSALTAICEAVVKHFHRAGYVGIFVGPHPEDIAPDDGTDLRSAAARNVLRMHVWAAMVADIRVVALGERFGARKTEDPRGAAEVVAGAYARIKENSPIAKGDVIRKQELDDYLFRLNRFPGRRVNASVASTGDPGDVSLDYLVTENKATMVYAQASNTGTKETNEWRERFGLATNHLLMNEDTLTLDYITAGFKEAHAVVGSYEAPLGRSYGTRWRVSGLWSQFDASEVGRTDEDFSGEEWSAGLELIRNVFQHHDTFVDAVLGFQWRHVMVDNKVALIKGEDDFLLPHAGIRLERKRKDSNLEASLLCEWSMPDLAGTDEESLAELGRLNVDDQWVALQWDASYSFYLEPLLGARSTLAHELALSARGQYAFDYRLIPQAERVIGGFYSVRGYEESTAAGDTVYLGSAEYRFHIPRSLREKEQQAQDWDLIFRSFIDVGRALNNQKLATENQETLVGTGVGLELQLKRNLNIRCDWGLALNDAGTNESGDNRVHLAATLLW